MNASNTQTLSQIKTKTLTLELKTPRDDWRPVYITGNFNNWTIDEERFRMQKNARGHYQFTFPDDLVLPNPLEYKYIRGGWDNVELDISGNSTPNRVRKKSTGIVKDKVPRWRHNNPQRRSFLPKIEVVAEALDIPQLGKKRKVYALLPYNYHESKQHYPVLYLQDAQNLFDDHAPYGNWAIDKKLALLAEKGMADIIVIAVDHGGAERINEFMPFHSSRFGKGEGKNYVRFISETLKPGIDQKYRTLPQRQFTGIGGSSMGGLISIYAGLMFPEVFGRLMIFSPSLWVAKNAHFDTIRFFNPIPTKIYAYAGGREGANMIHTVKRFRDSIGRKGFDGSRVDFKLSVDPRGHHNEARWGHEFPKAIEWLFFK